MNRQLPEPHPAATPRGLPPTVHGSDTAAGQGPLPVTAPTADPADETPCDGNDQTAATRTATPEQRDPTVACHTTSRRLVDAGLRAFATVGVERASLLGICESAGQRNRASVHYHFGSRAGLVAAVLDAHAGRWQQREEDLLLGLPADDTTALRRVLEAIVRPPVELSRDQSGRDHIAIINELLAVDPATLSTGVLEALRHAKHERPVELLRARLPGQPHAGEDRVTLAVSFVRQAILVRSRAAACGGAAAVDHDVDGFTRTLVDMALTILTAATSNAPRSGLPVTSAASS